ncbi:Hypothetical predicted protein [Cloeon dipterum]|uniref:Peptidase S1 domain-containing protein n=1 Tax=Cloeon dipterum TaxID=197152 RepID=A0A8S1DGV3_9INSE|nr:Hypothetical predicted protein [Cloeon dipterum]
MFLKAVLLFLTSCAVLAYGVPAESSRSSTLSGGTPAVQGEFPWHVSIQIIYLLVWNPFCDGVIISRDLIITHGFCAQISPESYQSYRLLAGILDYSNPGSIHKITETYLDEISSNFLGIMRVDPPFEFTADIGPVRLPIAYAESSPGTVMTVSGLGETSPLEPTGFLAKLDMPIVTKDLCSSLYQGIGMQYLICTGDFNNETGFCTQISDIGGAPLVYDGELRGVLFSTNSCVLPEVYSEVSLFRDWIFQIAGV